MLVKVKSGVYLNTEYITTIILGEPDSDHAQLFIVDVSTSWTIPITAAAHLLQLMEADNALILPGEPNYQDTPTEQPLTSRIAQFLRDSCPRGATVDELMERLRLDYHLIRAAVNSLLTERVVVGDPNDVIYHALHAPATAPMEKEVDLIDATPFISGIRAGEFQCIECAHQSCATCATTKACCKCDSPGPLHYEYFQTCSQTSTNSAKAIEIHEAEKAQAPISCPQAQISCPLCQRLIALHLDGSLSIHHAKNAQEELQEINPIACPGSNYRLTQKSPKPNRDLSTEGAALASHPGEDTES